MHIAGTLILLYFKEITNRIRYQPLPHVNFYFNLYIALPPPEKKIPLIPTLLPFLAEIGWEVLLFDNLFVASLLPNASVTKLFLTGWSVFIKS